LKRLAFTPPLGNSQIVPVAEFGHEWWAERSHGWWLTWHRHFADIPAQREYDHVSTITALEISQNSSSPRAQLARAHAPSVHHSHWHFSIFLRALLQTEDVKNNEQ
jgi:hypothetical protein